MTYNAEQRQNTIKEFIQQAGFQDVKSLSTLMGVSVATVRRDLNMLEERGEIQKKHGGAIPSLRLGIGTGVSFPVEVGSMASQKEKLGTKAAELVKPNNIIFLGAGNTCLFMAKKLKDVSNLTIITNNFHIVAELQNRPNIKLVFCGGDVCVENSKAFTIGQFAKNNLKDMYIQKAFFTVNGFSLEYGLSIDNHLLLDVYQQLHRNTGQTIILADSSKFDHRAFCSFCEIQAISALVTDGKIPERYIQYFEKNNIEYFIAD